MNALVDDLFTFPIGSGDDDGGDTKVYHISAGHTWTLTPLLMDESYGVATGSVRQLARFHHGQHGAQPRRSRHQRPGSRRPAVCGLPQFSTGFTAIGNTPSWSPIYRHESSASPSTSTSRRLRQARPQGRILPQSPDARRLAAVGDESSRHLHVRDECHADVRDGIPDRQFLQPVRAFLLGLVGNASKGIECRTSPRTKCSTRSMSVTAGIPPRLTLDFGLRWELYPIMGRELGLRDPGSRHPRDGARRPRRQSPNVGLVAPKDSFAPRVGGVYRLDDRTVVRAGYGLTYDAQGMSGELAFYGYRSYPLMLNASFDPPAAEAQFGWYGTLVRASRCCPTRTPAPDACRCRTSSAYRRRRRTRRVAERRIPGTSRSNGCRSRRSTSRTSAIASTAHSAVTTTSRTLGGGGLDRPSWCRTDGSWRSTCSRPTVIRRETTRRCRLASAAAHARPAAQGPLHLAVPGRSARATSFRPGGRSGTGLRQRTAGRIRSRWRSCIGCRGSEVATAASRRRWSATGRSTASSRRSTARRSP